MKSTRARKWFLSVLMLLLLPVMAYWLADAWLESSGGRQLLERELSQRLGMNVRIGGDFDLMLFPAIGVSGTDLVIGGEDGAGAAEQEASMFFAASSGFEVSVALKPLFRRQVVVEWIRLSDGSVYPDRYRHSGKSGDGSVAESVKPGEEAQGVPIVLPEIQELSLREFDFVLDPENDSAVHLKNLELQGFADGSKAPFKLEFEGLLAVDGWLRWDTTRSKIDFGDLAITIGNQALSGVACLSTGQTLVLSADLQGTAFDVDALLEKLPDTGAGGGDLPLDLRARLTVNELRSQGVVATGVVLNLGADPSCD